MKPPAFLKEQVGLLENRSSLRKLQLRQGIDLSSNDYLGFAEDSELRSDILFQFKNHDSPRSLHNDSEKSDVLKSKNRSVDEDQVLERFDFYPLGSSGSRLLRGHLALFDEAENYLAEFCGQEDALIFPSGYQANLAVLSCLMKKEDTVFSDQLNHASLIDGIRLSQARKVVYPHNDVQRLKELLKSHSLHQKAELKPGQTFIVTESLFGMDGDFAKLRELVELAEEFQAYLIVDEAHATGLWGAFQQNQGGGLVQSLGLTQKVLATLHPGGKALGVGGAWVAGSSELKSYLINFSRPFIFSTAPMPILALSLYQAARYWKSVGIQRAQLVLDHASFLRENLPEKLKHPILNANQGPILPIIVGENSVALKHSQLLKEQGFDIRAIRPPTVPENTARLRITVHFKQTREEIKRLVAHLKASFL